MFAQYCDVGFRFLICPMPAGYDSYGYNESTGEYWEHSFYIIDDYGNAVPVNPWPHGEEGCVQVLAPDYDNPPEPGEPYKYVLFTPSTIH